MNSDSVKVVEAFGVIDAGSVCEVLDQGYDWCLLKHRGRGIYCPKSVIRSVYNKKSRDEDDDT